MTKIFKIISVVIIATTLSYSSFQVASFIGEKYFFDKLFYKKSQRFGYIDNNKGYLEHYAEENILKKRVADLINLYSDDHILSSATTNNYYKVAIIGDSYAYGIGLKEEQLFSQKLEERLSKVKPTKVYNFSLPGDNLVQYWSNLKKVKEKINPDLTIITMVLNDFIFYNPAQYDHYPTDKLIKEDLFKRCGDNYFEFDRSKILSNTSWTVLVEKQLYPSSLDKYANTCYMNLFLQDVDMENTFFITLTPIYDGNFNSITPVETRNAMILTNKIMYKYIDLIKYNQGHVLAINPHKRIDINHVFVSKKENHYSKLTHQFIADEIYTEIMNNEHWDFN